MIAVIRHVPFEDLGYIAKAIEQAGHSYMYFDLYAGHSTPKLEDVEAVISMGGPMSANQDLFYLKQELRLIERACAESKPVLGICLGAQLIAKALGGRVYRNAVTEIGWAPIHWTPDARYDALFEDLIEPEVVFHWHSETFDPPLGAARLAWSDGCHNQAFRLGSFIYGFQFHLEVTPEMILDWCAEDMNCGELREIVTSIDPWAHEQRRLAGRVFSRWMELVTTNCPSRRL